MAVLAVSMNSCSFSQEDSSSRGVKSELIELIENRRNHVHKPIHLISCPKQEQRRLSVSGFEVCGWKRSLARVQAAVIFAGDEATIMCAEACREEG